MPLVGEVTQNAALDAIVAVLPASGEWRLYFDDPSLVADPTDVELDSTGGYAPVAHAPTDWAAASGAAADADVSFGTSTDAWSDVATYWGIVDNSGNLTAFDVLSTPVSVDAADTAVSITASMFFGYTS